MVTRDDVARVAGTSTAVVSYVINNGPRRVSPETRARVERALELTGYRPNGVARALRSRHSRILGVIVPDTSNAFFGELARAIEEAALRRGYLILLGNSSDDPHREDGYISAFLERQIEGLVIVGSGGPHEGAKRMLAVLEEEGTPTVFVDRPIGAGSAKHLFVDNRQGAEVAVTHLLSVHGHQQVACLAGPRGLEAVRERVRGWRQAHKMVGVKPDAAWLHHCPFDRAEALKTAHRWLSGPNPPRALFATSDEQARGVLRAARLLHLDVPRDLALVSFDGTSESAYTAPPLTTVAQNYKVIGQRAVEMLVEKDAADSVRVQHIPTELLVRESCGCDDGDTVG